MPGDDVHDRLPLVGRVPRDHPEQDAAQGVEVGPLVGGEAAGLLGRHVERRSQDHTVLGRRGIGQGRDHLGRPEVADLDAVVGVEEDVGGLQIAVDDPAHVGGGEGGGDPPGDNHRPSRGQRPLGQHRLQGRGLHQLHDEVGAAGGEAAEVGDVDDPGMIGEAGRASFADELRGEARVGCELPVEDLDGHVPARLVMSRVVDDTHAAPSQLAEDGVPAHLAQRLGGVPDGVSRFEVCGIRDPPDLRGEAQGRAIHFHQEVGRERSHAKAKGAEAGPPRPGVDPGQDPEPHRESLPEPVRERETVAVPVPERHHVPARVGPDADGNRPASRSGGEQEVGEVHRGHLRRSRLGLPVSVDGGPVVGRVSHRACPTYYASRRPSRAKSPVSAGPRRGRARGREAGNGSSRAGGSAGRGGRGRGGPSAGPSLRARRERP